MLLGFAISATGAIIIDFMKTASPLSLEELLARLPDYYTPADRELIQRAYRVAEKAHAGQKRVSGEPYINHLLAVAAILAEYSMPAEVVTAGLLHDTIEDTSITAEDLQRDFSDGVVSLVQGVTKLTQLPRVSRGEHRDEAGATGGKRNRPARPQA